jgi:hypothetical protein
LTTWRGAVVVVTGDPTVVGTPGGVGVGTAVLGVVAPIVVVVGGRVVIGLVVVVVSGWGAAVVVVGGADVVVVVAAVATSAARTNGQHATATAAVISSQPQRDPLTRIRNRTSLTSSAIAPAEPPHCTQERPHRSGAVRR